MKKDEAKRLLNKYLEGTCTVSEKKLVEAWLDQEGRAGRRYWKSQEHARNIKARMKYQIGQRISKKQYFDSKVVKLWRKLAAAVLLCAGIGAFLWMNGQHEVGQRLVVGQGMGEAVDPGAKSAVLTLGDGSVIRLNEAIEDGVLVRNNDGSIGELANGRLTYRTATDLGSKKADTNKITIPLGGLYHMVLPDGTDVWLNSASSLTYPTVFSGSERVVKLEGEAYFEVIKNEAQPFKVVTGDVEVAVMGTHFNVSAYSEESYIATTLLEGRVAVTKGFSGVNLVPGQQAVSYRNTTKIEAKQVDAASSVAWKNGFFVFDDQDIASVLREVARWYNVDIYIQGDLSNAKKIGGVFSRTRRLDELLHFLEKLKVATFEQTGRRVTVMI